MQPFNRNFFQFLIFLAGRTDSGRVQEIGLGTASRQELRRQRSRRKIPKDPGDFSTRFLFYCKHCIHAHLSNKMTMMTDLLPCSLNFMWLTMVVWFYQLYKKQIFTQFPTFVKHSQITKFRWTIQSVGTELVSGFACKRERVCVSHIQWVYTLFTHSIHATQTFFCACMYTMHVWERSEQQTGRNSGLEIYIMRGLNGIGDIVTILSVFLISPQPSALQK